MGFFVHISSVLKNKIHSHNKKVLLRERKRHTARRVASARSVAVSGAGSTPSRLGWGGVPYPQDWGTPPPPERTWEQRPVTEPETGR